MLCQQEEREAGRTYPRTCPTCRLGPCQKFGAKPLQSLSDARAEIARLTSERDKEREEHPDALELLDQALARAEEAEIDAEFFKNEVKLRNRIESTNDTAAYLQRKYEETLARAAAAAMEMRERAADYVQSHIQSGVNYNWSGMAETIRALPIDHDAQKALDKMLAKAREDAIREAVKPLEELAAVLRKSENSYHQAQASALLERVPAILALLNEGGQP